MNSVGIALGLSFLPPAGDLAISSNWLSSKWSWHSLEQGVGTKSRRQFTSHFLMRTGSFGKRKSCFPIVVEFEQLGAEHPPIFIYIRQVFNFTSVRNNDYKQRSASRGLSICIIKNPLDFRTTDSSSFSRRKQRVYGRSL